MYGQFDGPMTDSRLNTLIRDLNGIPARRKNAIKVLSERNEPKIVTRLLKEVVKKDQDLRISVLRILGRKEDERIERVLLKLLEEKNGGDVTAEICSTLGKCGRSRDSIRALIELTGNGNAEVTIKAKAAIGKIKNRRIHSEERRDPAHTKKEKLVTMAEIKGTIDDIKTRNTAFMKAGDELLEKMREISRKAHTAPKKARKGRKGRRTNS